jgi:potassium/hydrogen antiporter
VADVARFGGMLEISALVLTLAVLSNRLSERVRIPAPAFFLVAAAIASDVIPALRPESITTVQRIVTVALVVILFDGGMHIGARRFRANAGAILWLGVLGTLATGAALAAVAHLALGLDWRAALLLGTALSPTDPAVVFSVLGKREVAGRSGVLLEGESGANDPVGIAMMAALISVTGTGGASGFWAGLGEFSLEMGVGGLIGLAGGTALGWVMRSIPLPSGSLYPIRVLAAAGVVYGAASLLHGSGFLAVFVAGIVVGDLRAPYKREIERFHSALASLGEIVAFTVLGLTISLESVADTGAWRDGLVLGAVLALVIRPGVVGALVLPLRLRTNERLFVMWAGLKGAVPILLGTFILTAGDDLRLTGTTPTHLYGVVVVAVAFSVVVQGGLVQTVARRLKLPIRTVEPEPWGLGMRFRDEPEGVHRYRVTPHAPATTSSIADLPLGENAWVSLVIRDGRLVQVRGETVLSAGDEVVLLAEPEDAEGLAELFTTPART